ncbi:MAG: 2-oxoacid:acceptor oxidoreductase subunit alpha [Planctomycetota bacterium]
MNAQAATAGRQKLDSVVIRFAGDSGDGMQVTGGLFTATSALVGNDLATLPDFPAEIRAPAGTLPGVSGFQINFSSFDIHTPGDQPDVLVAMNPAALKANIKDLRGNGILIVNTDAFSENTLRKVGYEKNPLEDGSLDGYRVIQVDLTTQTKKALESSSISNKEKDRCKNFYALGLMYWIYNRPLEHTMDWIAGKFKKNPEFVEANQLALKAGYMYGHVSELFQGNIYDVAPATMSPGKYRNINGNDALVLGLVAASKLSGRPLFLGAYPITPASDVLHGLARYKHYGVTTFQAEDEIAAVGAAIGASFCGQLAVTTTSGPGVALKAEAIGLAVMTELPLVICNIQRAGPSTGLPTKTEQADLSQAMFGRNGEAPCPIVAPARAGECFDMAIEASRMATHAMVPVFLLSDGYLANGAEPWRIPDEASLPTFEKRTPPHPEMFKPYLRDEKSLARPWVVPGTPGYEHRLGGLEKWDGSGNVSYDPANHEHMIRTRQEKVDRLADTIPLAQIEGDQEGDVLLIGWGSTYGALTAARARLHDAGTTTGHLHLRYLNPLQKNVGELLKRFKHVMCFEMNMGQLSMILRAKYLVDCRPMTKIQGQPFRISEVVDRVRAEMGA